MQAAVSLVLGFRPILAVNRVNSDEGRTITFNSDHAPYVRITPCKLAALISTRQTVLHPMRMITSEYVERIQGKYEREKVNRTRIKEPNMCCFAMSARIVYCIAETKTSQLFVVDTSCNYCRTVQMCVGLGTVGVITRLL